MPKAQVRVFRDKNGTIPLKEWLSHLKAKEPKRYAKCLAFILLLEEFGSDLKRPDADYLRDGIYELRPVREKRASVQYRILYFYSGKQIAVVSHGIAKEGKVPEKEIEQAIVRKALVLEDPKTYTADWLLSEN